MSALGAKDKRSHDNRAFGLPCGVAAMGGLFVALHVSMGAMAADMPAQIALAPVPVVSGWEFSINAYGWAAGLNGRLRTLPPLPAVDVDIGFDQVLKNLNGALMGTSEARLDRLIFFSDMIYSKISPDKTFKPEGSILNVLLDSTAFISASSVGYRFMDDGDFTLDGFIGVRGFAMKNTLAVAGRPAALSFGKREQWLDGVVGARARYALSDNFSATVIAFAGGLSSKYEWDVYGGLGYAFSDRWGAFAGYRALKVNYTSGNFIYDALQHGPVLGVSFRY